MKGVVHATLITDKTPSNQDVYVVTSLKEPLLGRPTIAVLHLFGRVNNIQQHDAQSEYPELISGLGRWRMNTKSVWTKMQNPFQLLYLAEYCFH